MTTRVRTVLIAVAVAALAGVSWVSTAQAATYYFDVNGVTPGSGVSAGGSYNWTDANWANDNTGTSATGAGNWVGGSNSDAVFVATGDAGANSFTVALPGSGGTQTWVNNLTLNSGNLNITNGSGVNFVLGATSTWTVATGSTLTDSNPGTFGLNLNGNSLNLAGGGNTAFNCVVSNSSGGLTLNGTGTVTLAAANSYTGATTVNSGTLNLTANQSIKIGNTLTVNPGAIVNLAATGDAVRDLSTITVNGGTLADTSTTASHNHAILLTTGRTLNLQNGAMVTSAGAAAGNGNYGQLFLGYGGITINVTGTPASTLNADIHWGNTNTVNIASGSTLVVAGHLGNLEGSQWGYLNLTGGGTLIMTDGTGSQNTCTIGAGSTLQIGNGGTTGDFPNAAGTGGVTNNGTVAFNRSNAYSPTRAISGSGAVTQIGSGATTLSLANTYSGGTTVNAGTVVLNNASAVGSGAVTLAGGTLAVAASSTITGPLNVNVGATINATAGTLTLNGGLVGTGQSLTYSTTAGAYNGLIIGATGNYSGSLAVVNPGGANGNWGQLGIGTSALAALANTDLTISGDIYFALGNNGGGKTFQLKSLNGGAASGRVGSDNASNTLVLGTNDGSGSYAGRLYNGDGGGPLLTLIKNGAGTQTLSGANITYSGPTTINGGRLVLQNVNISSSSAITIGANTTLEYNASGVNVVQATTTLTGTGTLLKTGANQLRFGGSGTVNWNLGAGAMIDVEGGELVGGSSAQDVWTGNLAGLNVAAGATFSGVEANVRVDALTGSGTVASGYNGAGYANFTFGVNNGSGTFSGTLANTAGFTGNFVKAGTGTQTLSGANITYTGSTTVNGGTLVLQNVTTSSSSAIAIGANTTLEYNASEVDVVQATTTLTGTGTLLKTGANQLRFGGAGNVTWNLGAGAMIDVEGGTLVGGSSIQDFWTGNLAGLKVAAGATFAGVEANVRVDALTGAGTITSGYNGAGYANFTFGVNNGNGTFSGTLANTAGLTGNFVKVGTGTQTLSGVNTYTGGTTVNGGTLVLNAANCLRGVMTINSGALVSLTHGNATDSMGLVTINYGGRMSEDSGPTNLYGGLAINGGELAATVAGDPTYGNFVLTGGTVTAAGDNQSTISASLHLNGTSVFNVADGAAPIDLVVSGQVGNIEGSAWGYINKTGAGTMALTNANNGLGGVTISAGKLIFASHGLGNPGGPGYMPDFAGNSTLAWDVGNTQDVSASGKMRIQDGVMATLDTGANNVTLGTAIVVGAAKTGGLTKIGSGTLTLNAANTYIGATIVNAGTLVVTAANDGGGYRVFTSPLTVNNGATASVNANGVFVDMTKDITLNGGVLTATGTFNGNYGQIFLENGVRVLATGDNQSTLSAEVHMRGTHEFNVADGAAPIDLLVSGHLGNEEGGNWGFINKTGLGTMAISNTGNGIGSLTVSAGKVVFENSVSGLRNGGINTAAGAVTELQITSADYQPVGIVFTGSGTVSKTGTGWYHPNTGTSSHINMSGGLISVEAGNWTGNNHGNYVDATNKASLFIAGGATFGSDDSMWFDALSGAGSLPSPYGTQTLTLGQNNGSGAWAGVISGTWNLVKNGSGTQVFGGNNTYTGTTTVNGGKLLIDGSITSPVTVNSGGWLGGKGHVTGAVTVAAGGTVSAGDSPGHLTITGNYVQSGTMVAELGGLNQGVTYDWIDVNGTATLNAGSTVDVKAWNNWLTPGEGIPYYILTATGGITNNDLAGITFDFSSAPGWLGEWKASIVPYPAGGSGAEALMVEAVPEPATVGLVGLAVAGLGGYLRRRRNGTTVQRSRFNVQG